jgi:hypothetical protein
VSAGISPASSGRLLAQPPEATLSVVRLCRAIAFSSATTVPGTQGQRYNIQSSLNGFIWHENKRRSKVPFFNHRVCDLLFSIDDHRQLHVDVCVQVQSHRALADRAKWSRRRRTSAHASL